MSNSKKKFKFKSVSNKGSLHFKNNTLELIIDKGTPINSDFLSVPDLSAGGTLEYWQLENKNNTRDFSKNIYGWMCLNSTVLKKFIFICENDKDNKKLTSINNYTK